MPSTATNRLQGLTTSVAVKPPCITVATTNITLSGLQTISGVLVTEGDRVLVKGQSTASENGIYTASTGSWVRAKDFDGDLDAVSGTRVLVRNSGIDGAEYELTTANPITIGTTSLTFALRYGANATYDQTEAEIGTGVTPVNTSFFPPIGVDVRRFGVIGNGTVDDSTAMASAISTGQPLDLGNLTIRIVTKLTFNQANQRIYARGGGFKFDGASSTRLMDIIASGVEFHDVDFDANSRQVGSALIYIVTDAARPKFIKCRFRRINGTHVGGVTGNTSNNQSAVMISPYGVESFEFDGCTFDDLKNDNSGVNGTTPTEGLGFVNGVSFFTDNWAEPTTLQGIPTSGSIHDCLFKDIITVMGGGLSEANQINFNDADGIRFYGNTTGQTKLHVRVRDCTFYNCGKRAVKNSVAAGTMVENITVIATSALQYNMVTAVKVDGNDQIVDGVNVYSPAAAPIRTAIQSHDCQYLRVSNVMVDRCKTLWDIASTSTSFNSQGWRVKNIQCPSCDTYGFRSSTNCLQYVDCQFEGLEIAAAAGVNNLIAFSVSAATDRMEVTLRNSRIINGDVKISGYGYRLEHVYQEIDNASYTGGISSAGLLEAGVAPGTAVTKNSTVDDYELNIKALPDAYLTVSRPYIFLLYGDRLKVANFRIKVPDALATTRSHGSFDGNDMDIEGFEYSGEGFIYVGETFLTTKARMRVRGAKRVGGTAADTEFLAVNRGTMSTLADIDDYRDAAGGSITISGGTIGTGDTDAYVIDGVRSRTSGTPVSDGGGLARQVDVGVF